MRRLSTNYFWWGRREWSRVESSRWSSPSGHPSVPRAFRRSALVGAEGSRGDLGIEESVIDEEEGRRNGS